jgi:transposase
MGTSVAYNRWRVSEELWEKMAPVIPPPPTRDPSLGGRPRVPDRQAMDGILFVVRTGCQWNALNATEICSSSTAHLRFQAWTQAGVFLKLWEHGLLEYDDMKGLEWRWQSMDGAMTKAPLGGEKNRPQPHRQGQRRRETQPVD